MANLVILLVLLGLAVTVTASAGSQAAFAPIRQGKEQNTVAITVNVYLGDEYVREFVDILRNYHITATFFLGGCWVKKHPETCQILVHNRLCIGSHGYSHLDHATLDYAANIRELNRAADIIEEVTGARPTLFAPPSGAYNADMLKACEDLGYRVIMWSKDTIDWRDQDVSLIIDRATRNAQSGDIILMHPTAATVAALPTVIETYHAKGFRFVSVEQMTA